ncbi:MAG: membrane-associated protease RseP (regulator of RpoE activity), partial [Glaciecola sp.]
FAVQRLGGIAGIAGVVSWFLAVFVSLLIHEFGHAVAFRRWSLRPVITLYSMGGLTSATGRLTWGRSLIASLSGPFLGLGFGALVYVVHHQGIWVQNTLFERVLYDDLLFVNIGWGILNLMPLHPLDGGQALESTLHLLKVPRAGRKSAIISIATATVGVLAGIYFSFAFVALIAGYLGYTNYKRLKSAS